MAESKVCLNTKCGVTSTEKWRSGWILRSGEFADLCDSCGSSYEQMRFCETFHSDDAGWRTCKLCEKPVHCGCISSINLFMHLDTGGIECILCARKSGGHISVSNQVQQMAPFMFQSQRSVLLPINNSSEHMGGIAISGKWPEVPILWHSLTNQIEAPQRKITPEVQPIDGTDTLVVSNGELSSTSGLDTPEVCEEFGRRTLHQEGENTAVQQQYQFFLNPLHGSPDQSLNDLHHQIRALKPVVEGMDRSQLLQRYCPRAIDHKLQQISSDSNSIIKPLFEKTLSASDAGRVGRLVLPKACAEAYFPSISQPEGVPLEIQDVNGKDWIVQFRFWPNNNSRMYVLEGVTPCMQSMQLQAGDTVNFSRLEPEGKIIIGFRKALNSNAQMQEGEPSKTGNGASPSRCYDPGITENSVSTDFSGILFHPKKPKADPLMKELMSQFNDSDTDLQWYRNDEVAGKSKETHVFQSLLLGDKMQSHNLGSKSKRLRIDNEDALELKVTWEEAQDLFRPPLMAVPSVVIIEGHEFEEYEEPPILGKRTTFGSKCSRAPSAAREVSFKDNKKILQQRIGSRKKKISQRQTDLGNSLGVDVSANAATHGKKTTTSSLVSPTTKHPRHRLGCTCIVCIQPPSGKGPKHKPTCTCNVCMMVKRRFKTLMMRRRKHQSEKGAENTIKKYSSLKEHRDVKSDERRQSNTHSHFKNEFTWEDPVPAFNEGLAETHNYTENEVKLPSDLNLHGFYEDNKGVEEDSLVSKGRLDLNSQPAREEEASLEIGQARMDMLLNDTALPLDLCVKQHELPSLIYPPQISNTLGFRQSVSEGRVEKTSSVQNEDHIMNEELNSNRSKLDAKSVSI